MPIFFLHVRDGNELFEDMEGQEFISVHAAREEAVSAAREIAAEKVLLGHVVDGQTIEVVDEAGATVAVVAVREVVRLDESEAPAAT